MEEKFILEEINRELYDKFIQKYRTEKTNIEDKLSNTRIDLSNLEKSIKKYLEMCLNLPVLWEKASYHAKDQIQNIVFPEGILYDRENNCYRTPKTNSVILFISGIASSLAESIKRKTALLGGLSNVVVPVGERSYYEVEDFHKILEFTGLLEPLTD